MTNHDELPAETAPSPGEADTTTERFVGWLIHGCAYLFAIALVSMVGALVLGTFDHEVRRWGWVAGALLAAIGYPVGWVTFPGVKLRNLTLVERDADARRRRSMGPIGGSFAGIAMGVLLGVAAWFVCVIFWVSLALSPFTPDTWREGFQVSYGLVRLPPRPGLLILAYTTGLFAAIGIVLGLCGKMYRYDAVAREMTKQG